MRKALVIGINKYPNLHRDPLKTPARDAERIAKLLETDGNFSVKRLPRTAENTSLEVDPKQLVKLADLETAIAELFNPKGNDIPDIALLYFAGHGLQNDCGGIPEGYLATSDANPSIGLRGLSLNRLRSFLKNSSVRQQIIWLDCCYSGELLNVLNFEEANPGERGQGRDRFFITACNDSEVAYGSGEHGVLTSVLLQGLKPDQYPVGEWINNLMLANFINQQLKTDPILRTFPQSPLFNFCGGVINLIQGTNTVVMESVNSLQADICPYKGLEAFDFNDTDSKYFYGRTTLTGELIEKVRTGNFLAVIGPSGSGKSSVVRAGLLHELKLGLRFSGSNNWKILPVIRPGEHPLQSLAEAFTKSQYAVRMLKGELENKGALALQELVKEYFEAERVVLVIDQFEEAFTLCHGTPAQKAERQQFFECLLGALDSTDNKLCVVITMRADFLGECAEYAQLAKQIQKNLVTVTPMTTEELTQAIKEPAKLVGLQVEDSLVTDMIGEVQESPGSLPLLQFALKELWEKRDLQKYQLMRSQYTEMGGVIGSLDSHAQKIYRYKDCSLASPIQERQSQEQEWIKMIFLKLVRTGEGIRDTRQPQPRSKLLSIAGDDHNLKELLSQVLDELVDGRLLVTGGKEQPPVDDLALTNGVQDDQMVDLSHEALMKGWKEFAKWREENRQLLRLRDRLEDTLREWNREGKKKEDLMTGSLLARIRDNWATLQFYVDATAKEFYQQSSMNEQEQVSFRLLTKQLQETQEKLEELSRQQANLENHADHLTRALQNFDRGMGNWQRVAEWLKENQEELVETAAKAALDADSCLTKAGGVLDSPDKVQRFCCDINDYINWLRRSFELGSVIRLEETDLTPTVPHSMSAYVTAFNFIKGRSAIDLSSSVSEELEPVIKYLINYLSDSSLESSTD